MSDKKIEAVIGLEVHVQLATASKIFSSDSNAFGDAPNTNIGAVTIAHPGTLPVVSKEVVEMGMRLGMALNCDISRNMIFDRKNYFYPDLPKGYQITQDETPICLGGGVPTIDENGKEFFVELTKIHLEEDAGKSIHVDGAKHTNVDLNRAGVPLVEIVTEPMIENSQQAALCLQELRTLVRHLGISDGNMEQGSLRCDANISVRYEGDPLGSKVEVKNMNSIRNVRKAIDHEIERQTQMFISNEDIISETRTFDANTGTTAGMRTKEELNDYRYFPEPDISPVVISDEWYNEVKSAMPKLPREVKQSLKKEYGLTEQAASFISADRDLIDYFEESTKLTKLYKPVSNWMMGAILTELNETGKSIADFSVRPSKLVELVELVAEGTISQTAASQQLWHELTQSPDAIVRALAESLDLIQSDNSDELQSLIDEVLGANPDKVKAFHNGKKGLTGMFMGELMKKSPGKIDPKKANQLIQESLNKLK